MEDPVVEQFNIRFQSALNIVFDRRRQCTQGNKDEEAGCWSSFLLDLRQSVHDKIQRQQPADYYIWMNHLDNALCRCNVDKPDDTLVFGIRRFGYLSSKSAQTLILPY